MKVEVGSSTVSDTVFIKLAIIGNGKRVLRNLAYKLPEAFFSV
jgi:hypothetical protein